jgi:hypothetical protein
VVRAGAAIGSEGGGMVCRNFVPFWFETRQFLKRNGKASFSLTPAVIRFIVNVEISLSFFKDLREIKEYLVDDEQLW